MKKEPFDVGEAILAFEYGVIGEKRGLMLFQYLVDTGLAWKLQGHYGRTAKALLDAGRITPKGA